MGHESYQRVDDVKSGSDRAFGYVFAVVFTLIGLWPLLWGRDLRTWALAVAAVFLAIALIRPGLLAPLNKAWLRFGALLHRIVNPVVLGIIFFGVVAPTGYLMRAFGKDPLRLRWKTEDKSYWIDREPPGPAPESLKDQF